MRALVHARRCEEPEHASCDLLVLREGGGAIRNQDIRRELEALAAQADFAWLRKAVTRVDDIAQLVRATSRRPSPWTP